MVSSMSSHTELGTAFVLILPQNKLFIFSFGLIFGFGGSAFCACIPIGIPGIGGGPRPGIGGGPRPGIGGGPRTPPAPGNGGGPRTPPAPGNGGGPRSPAPGNGGGPRTPPAPGNGGGPRMGAPPGNEVAILAPAVAVHQAVPNLVMEEEVHCHQRQAKVSTGAFGPGAGCRVVAVPPAFNRAISFNTSISADFEDSNFFFNVSISFLASLSASVAYRFPHLSPSVS